MKMLTKFESKSTRAKGIAFHPSRPWVLVALFSSTIQLWDYRMGTLLHRFEGHEGPVRGVDFHPTQPIFASTGDDTTIKIWSLDTNKCIHTFTGHLDYVRTVFFHNELPWLITASDDQTIRIWNWQNRKEIACLTGHNHFVMCAQFHPTEDLIVSASLDETVRVWDISGLRKKHSAPGAMSVEDQMIAQQNLLDGGFGDYLVKFILEGHTRGVNWASFHPTLPLIVSGGDDRQVKLWRMSATKAWEVDTCRGHTNNVDCVTFHPHQNLILSAGEDKTLRIWDLDKRVPVKQFKRENDRFWLIASHPNINLFGAAHDSGVMIFKLDRERPCSTIYQNQLFFVNKQKLVQSFDFQKGVSSLPYVSLKSIGQIWSAFRNISYNPSQHSLLVNEANDKFALVLLPKEPTGQVDPTGVIEDSGNFATFVARNRFVVYNKYSESIEIRNLENKTTKSIKIDDPIKDIVYGGPGNVLLLHPREVVLYDVQQGKKLASITAKNVKYVSWSNDGQYVALMSKHTITLATKKLELINSMHETIRIKSAAWDETGVLIYSTLNHIRYSLLNGDRGIIKTLENTLYITRVKDKYVYTLNRDGEVEILSIDPTEYRFKKALVNKNFPEVLRIIKNSNLVGQNIISYLQKSGYPEIALQFVQDPQVRFDLALESGNLTVALEEAKKLNEASVWERLNKEALLQGNTTMSEMIYQTQNAFDRLSFLYLLTGDNGKLSKMEAIAENRGDMKGMILNSIYNNSPSTRANTFSEGGSLSLAYAIAKANGDETMANEYLAQAEINENEVVLPDITSRTSHVLAPTSTEPFTKWPLKDAELSYFEKAISGQIDDLDINEEPAETETTTGIDAAANEGVFIDEESENEEAGAWDMGDEDLDIGEDTEQVEDGEVVVSTTESSSETATWVKNSKLPSVLVAAGAFGAAGEALNKQVGVVEFEPLRKYFTQRYASCRTYLASTPVELPAIEGFIRSSAEGGENILPFSSDISTVVEKLQDGFKLFKANKLEEAIEVFREIIYLIMLLAVDNEEDEHTAQETLRVAKEYILGLSIELERRSLDPSNIKRNLELAAYFTKADLLPLHRSNALQVAMSQNFKHKNFVQASYFASEFLEIVPTGSRAEQARKIKSRADAKASDDVTIDFDPYAEFQVCAATHTPIYKDTPSTQDPLTGAVYHASEKGKIDSITLVTKIGAPASGLRIRL
ncbi:similar to Saccharomyces cerevisiae YDL145C COP1 Alpha subunit of COPI vesicle coatomer complex, which surrounds transport vesicles in the early secretory pathway [Maudiozyma saulgeensis]|uniref:Coatomer subunit alpha n=1 Tax=Maudiozyma saulgeensis TaxID=1789683 RepID=A0A1X7R2J7_9SACH|nr:similar to Saccharomyces cerevisiae YDL145C COP1 Alpha subunit of COPI vesicle coatomer complex, which surrounds transport vesicles in the early secretory pathway [Kazachstania saulgeensis]